MEQEVFAALARQYRDMIFRIALNSLADPTDAEDAAQEVLLKLYLCKKPFQGAEHVRSWLIRVTLNQCRNTLRSPWRRCVPLEELAETVSFDRPEQSELFRTVMGMPEKDRTVLYLFYYEELSVREIAGLLRLSETAVTSRLSRARGKLKTELTEVVSNG